VQVRITPGRSRLSWVPKPAEIGVRLWASAIPRFKRRCSDRDGDTRSKSKAGRSGKGSSTDCSTVLSASPNHKLENFNEFYQKGCQEKSSASTGGEIFFLEIQPTEVSLLWRSLADCPCSYVSSADGGVVIEFQRAASQTAIQGQPWFYPRLVAYGYFWFSEGA
jgi:hypothetical protein